MNKKFEVKEHFNVPEGYFETFTEQMMAKLPEQPYQPIKVGKAHRIWYVFNAAAAAVVLALVCVSAVMWHLKVEEPQTAASSESYVLDINPTANGTYTVEDAADCAMIDRLTMYEMITE